MPALSFDVFLEKLISGEKRQTIREPRKRPLKKGDKLVVYWKQRSPNNMYLGTTEATSVKRVPLGTLTEEEARWDGYASKREMLDAFRSSYGEGVEKKLFDVIRFKPLNECD